MNVRTPFGCHHPRHDVRSPIHAGALTGKRSSSPRPGEFRGRAHGKFSAGARSSRTARAGRAAAGGAVLAAAGSRRPVANPVTAPPLAAGVTPYVFRARRPAARPGRPARRCASGRSSSSGCAERRPVGWMRRHRGRLLGDPGLRGPAALRLQPVETHNALNVARTSDDPDRRGQPALPAARGGLTLLVFVRLSRTRVTIALPRALLLARAASPATRVKPGHRPPESAGAGRQNPRRDGDRDRALPARGLPARRRRHESLWRRAARRGALPPCGRGRRLAIIRRDVPDRDAWQSRTDRQPHPRRQAGDFMGRTAHRRVRRAAAPAVVADTTPGRNRRGGPRVGGPPATDRRCSSSPQPRVHRAVDARQPG